MTLKTPLLMQAGGGDTAISYSALDLRTLFGGLFAGEGVVRPVADGSSPLKATQRAAGANFSVDVSAGRAVVAGDDVSNQGPYMVESTAIENLVIPSPPVSGTRTHRVVAQVRDKLHNGAYTTYDWVLQVLEDTGSGTPAVPASAIGLARVAVTAGQSSVTTANITDDRVTAPVAAAKFPQVASDATRPGNPFTSELVWRTDALDYEVWDGSAWRRFGINAPYAMLGRITSNQSVPDSTPTALQWNTEFADSHNGHDNSTNPSRYTAQLAGLYQVITTAIWLPNSAGIREISVRVNGSTTYDGSRTVPQSSITQTQQAVKLVRLGVGDYVEAMGWQNSGGALGVDRTFHAGPLMDVLWVRP